MTTSFARQRLRQDHSRAVARQVLGQGEQVLFHDRLARFPWADQDGNHAVAAAFDPLIRRLPIEVGNSQIDNSPQTAFDLGTSGRGERVHRASGAW